VQYLMALRCSTSQDAGVQLAVQRMLLQLHTSNMLFRLRVTGTVSSVTASLLNTPGASAVSCVPALIYHDAAA
jgi:hypothetical protein